MRDRFAMSRTGGGIHVTFDMFLDRPHVVRRIEAKRLNVYKRGGAYGRGVMRRLQRRVGPNAPPSRPGEAPRARIGLIRDLTFFGLADADETAVIGPLPFKNTRRTNLHGKASIPQLLNEGGRQTSQTRRGPVTLHYDKRPFTDLTGQIVFPWVERLVERTPL